jgi:hypothetical protein
MWNTSVFDCYRKLVHEGVPESELMAFTRAYKSPDDSSYIANIIRGKFGDGALNRILDERLLEIRAYATILDTFWLIDGKSGHGRCQLSLANAMDGPSRPFFFCGEDDQPKIFDYYDGLADIAFSVGTKIWPADS